MADAVRGRVIETVKPFHGRVYGAAAAWGRTTADRARARMNLALRRINGHIEQRSR